VGQGTLTRVACSPARLCPCTAREISSSSPEILELMPTMKVSSSTNDASDGKWRLMYSMGSKSSSSRGSDMLEQARGRVHVHGRGGDKSERE
jgi:hypothetical protein